MRASEPDLPTAIAIITSESCGISATPPYSRIKLTSPYGCPSSILVSGMTSLANFAAKELYPSRP